ncbi:unnamed protein product [Heterobilharzia americana]|nr:unnamed protein product [Heterobilharzia americana]
MFIKVMLIKWCYHHINWKTIVIIYFKWIIFMDLLILLHLNKTESNSEIIIESNQNDDNYNDSHHSSESFNKRKILGKNMSFKLIDNIDEKLSMHIINKSIEHIQLSHKLNVEVIQ